MYQPYINARHLIVSINNNPNLLRGKADDSNRNRLYKLLGFKKGTIGQDFIISELLYDTEGIYSFTHHNIADELCRIITTLSAIGKNPIITDAMAGIGGNAIAFTKRFSTNLVECNKFRYDAALYNINLLTGSAPIESYCCYYQDIYRRIKQDIVFIDAPWGGNNYKKSTLMRIKIKGADNKKMSLEQLVIDIADNTDTKYCILKLPLNYDFEHLCNTLSKCGIEHYNEYDMIYSQPYSSAFYFFRLKNTSL